VKRIPTASDYANARRDIRSKSSVLASITGAWSDVDINRSLQVVHQLVRNFTQDPEMLWDQDVIEKMAAEEIMLWTKRDKESIALFLNIDSTVFTWSEPELHFLESMQRNLRMVLEEAPGIAAQLAIVGATGAAVVAAAPAVAAVSAVAAVGILVFTKYTRHSRKKVRAENRTHSLIVNHKAKGTVGNYEPVLQSGVIMLDPKTLSDDQLLQGFNTLAHNQVANYCVGPGNPKNIDPDHKVDPNPPFERLIKNYKRDGCPRPVGFGSMLVGMSTQSQIVAARQCPCSAHNSVCNRHHKTRPPIITRPTEGRDWLNAILEPDKLRREYMSQYSAYVTKWIHRWTASKQKAIIDSIIEARIDFAKFKLFNKLELSMGLPKKARGIQFCADMTSMEATGPQTTSFQKAVGVLFDNAKEYKGIEVLMGSGKNSEEIGEWMERCWNDGFEYAIERDGKAWDSTMRREHYMDAVIDHVERCDPALARAMKKGLDITAHYYYKDPSNVEYKMKAKSDGTTKSGTNWTTIANNLINAMIAVDTCLRLGYRARVIVGGDDLLVMVHRDCGMPSAEKITAMERLTGIDPEVGVFHGWQNTSFISGSFYPLADGKIGFGPKMGRLFAKLFWTTRNVPQKIQGAYTEMVAKGLVDVMGGHPILGAFLEANRKERDAALTENQEKYYLGWLEYSIIGNMADRRQVDRELLMQFYIAKYGLDYHTIAEVESLFLAHRGKVGIVKHDVLDRIVAQDMADPADRRVFSWA